MAMQLLLQGTDANAGGEWSRSPRDTCSCIWGTCMNIQHISNLRGKIESFSLLEMITIAEAGDRTTSVEPTGVTLKLLTSLHIIARSRQ